ncbi:MAG: PxKF domain-containing protein [Anaerolineaceae bacterium]|nr:PxKF domain-containing protein [Anaerolineaceae bacterium]
MPADPGYYVPAAEATEQLPCLPGTYQPNAGATSCFITDAGYYVDIMAAVTQFACAPGYYQPFSGGVSCIAADPGFYVDTMAATAQLACPAGTTSTAAASVACTPVGYNFTGFFEPVDMAAVNVVKAGRAVPIKFSLGGDFGLDILAAGSPISTAVTCDNNAPTGEVEETVSPGASVLSYDAATDTYIYVWKTSRTWAKSCRVLTVTLDDGSVHEATFKFNQ